MKKFVITGLMCLMITKANAMLLTGLLIGGTVGYLMGGSSDKKETTVIYEHSKDDECKNKIYHYNKDKTVRSIECIK